MLVQVQFITDHGFEHIANVDAPDHYDVERSLEYAFRRCQNLGGSWSMSEYLYIDGERLKNPDYDASITVVRALPVYNGREYGHRSAMVGDRMVVQGKTYSVSMFGFDLVEEEIA